MEGSPTAAALCNLGWLDCEDCWMLIAMQPFTLNWYILNSSEEKEAASRSKTTSFCCCCCCDPMAMLLRVGSVSTELQTWHRLGGLAEGVVPFHALVFQSETFDQNCQVASKEGKEPRGIRTDSASTLHSKQTAPPHTQVGSSCVSYHHRGGMPASMCRLTHFKFIDTSFQ